jgi:gag-polyprotein putative aspartyl protease
MKSVSVFRALLLAAPLLASPALAESGGGCWLGAVVGLDPNGDNFLSVRRAPNGAAGLASEKDRLHKGDTADVCQQVGRWLYVTYKRGGGRFDGWVFSRYIAPAPQTYAPAPAYVPSVYVAPAPAYVPPSLPPYLQLIDGGNTLYAPIMLGDIPINAMVDTGATHLSITESLADQLLQTGQAAPGPDATVAIADGSESIERTVIIYRVTVAGRVIHNVRAGAASNGSPLLLGLSVLSSASARVILDIADKRLVFE